VLTRLQAPPYETLTPYLPRGAAADPEIETQVRAIIEEVRAKGDAAVRAYSSRFDGVDLPPERWEVTVDEQWAAVEKLPEAVHAALEAAIERVRVYHRKQLQPGFLARDDARGLGLRIIPLDSVGVYVPGGKASYPSTVVMTVVPAVVAGVRDIVVVTPPGGAQDAVIAAARLAGASRIFRLGGVHAVAALAFGTATVPRVDKIVGPGNKYVTEAKRQLVGQVGIDMLAGPTEVAVLCDDTADISHVAADLIAQAEHDEAASAWCITTSTRIADGLDAELERQLQHAPRRAVAEISLRRRGVLVLVPSIDAAINVANQRAPEHLELIVENAWDLVERVRHAGAVFVGRFTPEPVGDYFAGPSHVLPTAGTARYMSPLGVYDFVKRMSVIGYSPRQLEADASHIIALAEAEGLHGHAAAVRIRLSAISNQLK
jgi:histidinol dehydrogenase